MADRIAQVLSNLVSITRHHGVICELVRITLAALPGGLRLTVANVASPIPPYQIDPMFDPLTRIRARSPRNPAGLGPGLYFVFLPDDTDVVFTRELGG